MSNIQDIKVIRATRPKGGVYVKALFGPANPIFGEAETCDRIFPPERFDSDDPEEQVEQLRHALTKWLKKGEDINDALHFLTDQERKWWLGGDQMLTLVEALTEIANEIEEEFGEE